MILTTTRWQTRNGSRARVALRSADPLPFAGQPAIVRQFKRNGLDPLRFAATPIGL